MKTNSLPIAHEVLRLEAESILKVSERLTEVYEEIIQKILALEGRLILCGIGKSAHIAQKIVATMNSTGTPALFLHAAEAMHGDLGMVQQGDMVMMISKSGNTPELKTLFPYLKKVTNQPIIAMVGNMQSYLAEQADYVLDMSIEREACPHDLAPTTSTTVTLALGDAIAVSLLKLRQFSADDFARFHPGGALGKRLVMKVSDVMEKRVPLIHPNASLKEVIIAITEGRKGCVVVQEQEKVVGIITDGDIRRAIEKYENIHECTASKVMSVQPKTVQYDEFAYDVLRFMESNKISQVLVMEQNQLVGIVHLHDLLNVGLK